jgi:hypothetical protein
MRWLDTHAGWLGIVLAILCLIVWALVMTGCGSTTERTERLVEREDLVAGPMTVETPIGNFVMHPTTVRRFRTQDTVENSQKEYNFPEAREIGGAMLGGLTGPLAGGGLVGLGAAFLMRRMSSKSDAEKKALADERDRTKRHFDEVVDGVERGTADMPDEHWQKLRGALEAEQSADTKRAVKARVG